MDKTVELKDGSTVLIRPMIRDELEKSLAFFHALPEEDRLFLRTDVIRKEYIQRRFRDIDAGRVKRIVAVVGDEIVADGALELEGHEWKEHVAELRLIVARPYQRKGLGLLMARELYALAAADKVEEIVVKMMRPQKGARAIFRKLGFHEEIVMPDYVKDRHGQKQDLIVMRCDLEALWKEMEEFLHGWDWQRLR